MSVFGLQDCRCYRLWEAAIGASLQASSGAFTYSDETGWFAAGSRLSQCRSINISERSNTTDGAVCRDMQQSEQLEAWNDTRAA